MSEDQNSPQDETPAPDSSVRSLLASMQTREAKQAARTPAASQSNSETQQGKVERINASKPRNLTKDEQAFMDRFFVRMAAIYRHLWSSSFDSAEMLREAQKEWMDFFYRKNLTWREIGEGLVRCKDQYERPPSPKEFLAVIPRRRGEHRLHQRLPEPEEERKQRMAEGRERIRGLKAMVTQDQTDNDNGDTSHE